MQETLTPSRIVRATSSDAALVASARERLLAVGLGPDTLPAALDELAGVLGDPATVVELALRDDQPIGLAYLERQPDGRVQIHALVVAPGSRRQGVGAELLTTALIASLPAVAIFACIGVLHRDALEWARNRGFRQKPPQLSDAPFGYAEFEIRLDTPVEACGGGCGAGSCACGGGGCGHNH